MANIDIEKFFTFTGNEPVNRIAYTEEDAKYKLQYMKAMQDLGMSITIDEAGNICGTLPGKHSKNKNLVMGSHTDSVYNGGQFDGPVGVYMALKSVEKYKEAAKTQYGNLKVAIYACEESSRFSKACLGSHYLSGELSLDDLAELQDKQGISFTDAVRSYREYILNHLSDYGIKRENVKQVDRILTQNEITTAIESHIEQSENLSNLGKSIGIVDSIGKPVRGKLTIRGRNSIVTSAKIVKELNRLAKESKSEDGEEDIRITVPQFDSNVKAENEAFKRVRETEERKLIRIDAFGKNNHSGATAMDQRQDAVLGIASLVLKLQELKESNPDLKFDFVGSATPKWGANQVQNYANLVLCVGPNTLQAINNGAFEEALRDVQDRESVRFEREQIDEAEVSIQPFSQLFVDVRQQGNVKGNDSRDRLYELFKKIQHDEALRSHSISCKISDKGDPVKTAPELLESLRGICEEKKIPYVKMHSWPGHDLACIMPPSNKNGKRILFFIPSQGGSHNPNETTSRNAIEIGTDVYSTFVQKTMREFEEAYLETAR